jgi:mono/diheme cytochrome c family protein
MKMKRFRFLERGGLMLSAAALCLSPIAQAQDVPNPQPYYDPSTGIMTIPVGTVVGATGTTPTFTDIEMTFTGLTFLGFDVVTEGVTDQVARGALAYSKYWVTQAGGDGTEPAHSDYTRCKACHGWDLLATAGGYVRRTDGGGTRSGPVNIRLDKTNYNAAQILNGNWVPGVDAPEQSHPDYNGILTPEQAADLAAYLNFRDGKFDAIGTVDNAANPAGYNVPFGDETTGGEFYSSNCVGCHGQPEDDSAMFPAGGPAGGILQFFEGDGKPSELAHKVRWGEAGSIMTRSSMGNPTSQDIANLMRYLQSID